MFVEKIYDIKFSRTIPVNVIIKNDENIQNTDNKLNAPKNRIILLHKNLFLCYKVMQRFGQLGLLLVNTILKNVVQLWVLYTKIRKFVHKICMHDKATILNFLKGKHTIDL